MIRLEWKDCRLTAEGTQVVLENAALRTCWRLEPEGLALACVENRLTGFCWQSADGAAPILYQLSSMKIGKPAI